MAVDPYSYSPCGTDKKIKFYCPEMLPDIEKIERMLAGEQRVGCLEYVRRLEEKHPNHSIPLFFEAVVRLEMGDEEGYPKAAARFLEHYPDNPVAHSFQAIAWLMQQDIEQATASLQDALERLEGHETVHLAVLQAIEMLATLSIQIGRVVVGRALYRLLMNLATSQQHQEIAQSMLMRIQISREIPELLKLPLELRECPADFPNQEAFKKALADAKGGRWRRALSQFEDLRKSAPRNVAILRNLATLALEMGDEKGAITYLHGFAVAAERSELEGAVEAETLARFLDLDSTQMVERTKTIFEIVDLEGFLEKLRLSELIQVRPIDPEMMSQMVDYLQQSWVGATEDETLVPPKMLAALFDRPSPSPDKESLTVDDIPHWVAELLVFGKESDREARVEFRNDGLSSPELAERLMAEIGGETLKSDNPVRKQDEVPFVTILLHEEYEFPENAAPGLKRELLPELRRHRITEVWGNHPLDELDGKTPREAAGDSGLRMKLAAALTLLEVEADSEGWDFDFEPIRAEFKLPPPAKLEGPLDPTKDYSSICLARMDAAELSDDDLWVCFMKAAMQSVRRGVLKLGREVVRRGVAPSQVPLSQLYSQLYIAAEDPHERLEFILKAQELAQQEGSPLGMHKVAEFDIRIQLRDTSRLQPLLVDLQRNHFSEPGVPEALQRILQQLGVGGGEAPPHAAAQPPAQAEEGLWTPGGASPAASQPEGESKQGGLWLPGMD